MILGSMLYHDLSNMVTFDQTCERSDIQTPRLEYFRHRELMPGSRHMLK